MAEEDTAAKEMGGLVTIPVEILRLVTETETAAATGLTRCACRPVTLPMEDHLSEETANAVLLHLCRQAKHQGGGCNRSLTVMTPALELRRPIRFLLSLRRPGME